MFTVIAYNRHFDEYCEWQCETLAEARGVWSEVADVCDYDGCIRDEDGKLV